MAFLNRFLILPALALALLAAPAQAENLQLSEQKIKAGLLYNFLKYTRWPASALGDEAAPLVVCLLGEDPFEGGLEPMRTRSVNQRNIVIRELKSGAEITGCHLLFVPSGRQREWENMRASLSDQHVLTVGDYRGFIDHGGMIEFGHKNDRIEVSLRMAPLKEANLQVEERLLKLVSVAP